MFTSLEDIAAPGRLQRGDVVFVNKTSNCLGRGTNRTTKATGLQQLNQMLSKQATGVTTAPLTLAADPALMRRVLAIRHTDAVNARRTLEHAGKDFETELAAAAVAEAQAKDALDNGMPVSGEEAFNPVTDWAALAMGDWTLDGVLIGIDGEDEFSSESPILSRNDGLLLNVAVAGPTPLRNSAPTEADAQVIDQRITVLDKVFVGLFSERRRTAKTDSRSSIDEEVGFQLKLFSGAQAHAQARAGGQFERLCGAWRVGSIMDSRFTVGHVLTNVCTEWWPRENLFAWA
jgi:hypothetical protein